MRHVRLRYFIPALLVLGYTSSTFAFRDSGQVVNYGSFKYVTSIATSVQRAYFATTQGIIVFNKTQNRWETPLTGVDGIDAGTVKHIWVDRFDERIFAETDAGKYEYDLMFGRWTPAFDIPALPSEDRHLPAPAVLFPPFGFNYDGNGGLIDPQARKHSISDVVDDGAGTLWVGTWGYGVMRADSRSKFLEELPYGLLQNAVFALHKDDSALYVVGPVYTSRRTGITALDLRTNSYRYIETGPEFDLPAEDVRCLDVHGNRLMVGTRRGLYELDKTSGRVRTRIDRSLKLQMEDFTAVKLVGDSIFAGTTDGLVLIVGKSENAVFVAPSELAQHTIYDLELVDNQLWIGSDVGAYRLTMTTGKVQKFQDPDHLLFNRVYDITSFGRSLWLSSDAGAVKLHLDSGTTTPYHIISHRLGTRAIAANDQIAALASDVGLSIIFLDGDRWRSRELSTSDGLLSTYVFALLLDGETLWIGTDRGLTGLRWTSPRLRN